MRVTFVDNLLLSQAPDGYAVDLQPHLGLIALIGALRRDGTAACLYDPKLAVARGDVGVGPGMADALAERICAGEPDVVGFTSLGCNFVATRRIARAVRARRPGCAIVLGGPHATILDAAILERCATFDAIARGEADETIAPLIAALAGSSPLSAVAGVTYRRAGAVVRTDAPAAVDLEALAAPAYDAYPIEELGLEKLRVDAGRGCPFACTFCSTAEFFGRRYRLKSPARLAGELRALASRYGVRRFDLSHDLFTVNAAKVRAFCAEVAPLGYAWTCSARLDCVDDALLATMREAGCVGMYYGVETGSPKVQHAVQKRLALDLYHPRLARSLELGIAPTASFILGYPEEDEDDRDATLDLIGETFARYGERVDVQLHLLTPEPGTAMLRRYGDTLAYDGHVGGFNVPVLEPDDEAEIRADPELFACRWHYAAGLPRDATLALLHAFGALRSAGPSFAAALSAGRPLSAVVRDVAAHARDAGCAWDGVVAASEQRFGAAHPLAELARFFAAYAALRPEAVRAVPEPGDERPLRLASCVAVLDPCRDVEVLLRRLRAGEPLAVPGDARAPRIVVADRTLRGRCVYAIDATTLAVARALREPLAPRTLRERFPGRGVDDRLELLRLLGAVVPAGYPFMIGPSPSVSDTVSVVCAK